MSEKNTCCAKVWDKYSYKSHPCGKGAKFERDGKHYCGTHDPVAVKDKNDARKAKWEQHWAEDKKRYQLTSAAPEMLSALQQIIAKAEQSEFKALSLLVIREIAAPVIAKATGADKAKEAA